jgi:hypothetical protein
MTKLTRTQLDVPSSTRCTHDVNMAGVVKVAIRETSAVLPRYGRWPVMATWHGAFISVHLHIGQPA